MSFDRRRERLAAICLSNPSKLRKEITSQTKPMWKKEKSLQEMQAACIDTLVQNLGMEFTLIGPDFIEARMPVDHRTMQPMGFLHGGASAAFAETLGGAGAYLSVTEGVACVGLEINANHVRPAKQGWVFGRATAVHLGKTTQVWDIRIRDEQENLVCIARLTVAVREACINSYG